MNAQNWPYWSLLALVLGASLPPLGWLPVLTALCLARLGRGWVPFLLLLVWAWWRVSAPLPPPLAAADGLAVDVVAVVVEPPVARLQGCRMVADVHHWVNRVEGFGGRWVVEWRAGAAGEVAVGDWWRLSGKLVGFPAPDYPGAWDGRLYWNRRGVTQRLRCHTAAFLRPPTPEDPWSAVCHWRARLTQRLADRLQPTHSGLIGAIVYGDGSRLSAEISDQFRCAGVSHLLVASGANVAVLVAWLCWWGGLAGYSPHRCAGAALWLVPFYVVLAGASPAMVRAGAMGWLALLARWTGHTLDLGRALVLGCVAVLGWDPQYIFDLGFQLSFAAVASLAWLQPRVQLWLAPLGGTALSSPLSAGLACSLGLAPVCWSAFHILQPMAVPANLWMGPLVEALLPAGLAWSLLDLLDPRLGSLAAKMLEPWLWFVEQSVAFWAGWAYQLQVPEPGLCGWFLWGLLLGMVCLGPRLLILALLGPATWLLCVQREPPQGLQARWLWLGPSPCLWLLQGQQHVLVLGLAEQAERAQQMRLDCGYPAADRILALDQVGWKAASWGDGWLQTRPGCFIYRQGSLSLGFAQERRDLEGLTWGLDSTGQWCWEGGRRHVLQKGEPWQFWHVHRQIWVAPWR
jgi:ComEC/Rec2-related protein